MTWLGLDIGTMRTGAALSKSGHYTQPCGVITGNAATQLAALAALIEKETVLTLVVGTASARSISNLDRFRRQLIKGLHRRFPELIIITVDETLTTKEAERLARMQTKKVDTDVLAAQLILEQFLEEENRAIQ